MNGPFLTHAEAAHMRHKQDEGKALLSLIKEEGRGVFSFDCVTEPWAKDLITV
jgi:hypothetical protein